MKRFYSVYGGIFLIVTLALSFVYIAEHVFGIKPCPLCLLQRGLFFLILGLSCVGIVLKRRVFLLFISGVFFLTAGLAGYQAGAEYGLISLPKICQIALQSSIWAEVKKLFQYGLPVPCAHIQWTFAGLSIAAYNFLFSSFVGIVAILYGRNKFLKCFYRSIVPKDITKGQ